MKVLRTPDERFENLADFPYEPHYLEVDDGDGGRLRIHYLDEGPAGGETVLCVHGQPVWSYSFRKMIPALTAAGFRVIAPDLVGFGRSDKPAGRSDYTYANHVHWIDGFVRGLGLDGINLVCQDWGGPICLRIVARYPHRFTRIVAANTGLPDAEGIPDERVPHLRKLLAETPLVSLEEVTRRFLEGSEDRPAFFYWIRYCDACLDFQPGEVVRAWLNHCTDEEFRAYSAPFPSEEYQQGARQFPSLVPLIPDDPAVPGNRKAWEALRKFDRPFLTAFSDDPGTTADRFQREVPGAIGQRHVVIANARHYVQDDAGEELARVVVDFIRST